MSNGGPYGAPPNHPLTPEAYAFECLNEHVFRVLCSIQSRERAPVALRLTSTLNETLNDTGRVAFCGPTIVYALMQATGMVDDHAVGCWRHGQ